MTDTLRDRKTVGELVADNVKKLECCLCQQEYEIRSESPGWASVWDFCPSCQLEDDKHE